MRPPANDDDEYVYGTIPCTFDELMAALSERGAVVQRGLITDDGEFIVQAND